MRRAAARRRGMMKEEGPAVTYATWDSGQLGSGIVLSGGDLIATHQANDIWRCQLGTIGKSTGKHYFEILCVDGNLERYMVGVANAGISLETHHAVSSGWGWFGNSGDHFFNGNNNLPYTAPWSDDAHIIGVAVDIDAGKIWYSIDGAFNGDPVAGTGEAPGIAVSGTVYIAGSSRHTTMIQALRASPANLTYSPPSGFNNGWYV